MTTESAPKPATASLLPRELLFSFILVTSLFSLWGFANDITNPMVAAFKNVLLISHFESSLVQAAFYGGYCLMAIPAALFIRRFTFKSGILMGLLLYASGCFLFVPAGKMMQFEIFLIAYLIMTSGLAFLETTANPYVLSMGDEKTAARRLNFAQAFNPMGSLCGMFIAKEFILARLNSATETERLALQTNAPEQLSAIQQSDLGVIVTPYVILGIVVLAVFVIFLIAKLPETVKHSDHASSGGILGSVKRLWQTPRYRWGVVAQAFYVGVQIMVWTFVIQYGVNELGMERATVQGYNIIAMIIFVSSRFICTYLLKFVNAGLLLSVLAIGGGALILGAIFLKDMNGLYCLMGVSACMSLMFPTIYGIALTGLGEDAKIGSAGLICAIGGGCVMPPLQALIMDGQGINLGELVISATRLSFFLPFCCFVVITIYGVGMFIGSRKVNNA